jgi:hypothetical protein
MVSIIETILIGVVTSVTSSIIIAVFQRAKHLEPRDLGKGVVEVAWGIKEFFVGIISEIRERL